MRRLDGNKILIVDSEWHYALQLSETLSDVGAICTVTSSFHQAKSTLINDDFDLILCSQKLDDGTIANLYAWSKIHLPMMPVFAALGDNKVRNEYVLKDCKLAGYLDKPDPQEMIQQVSNFLFNFEDFVSCILNMTDTSSIHYELHLSRHEFNFRPSEATEEGMFFETDDKCPLDELGFLHIYFFDGNLARKFILAGYPELRLRGGHFFKVHLHYLPVWNRVMKKLDLKQEHISNFLKKAAGY